MPSATQSPKRFNLLRWFSLLCCIAIVSSTMVTGTLLSQFLTEKLLAREASIMTEFINSTLKVEEEDTSFADQNRAGFRGDIEEFFRHIGELPSVLRANMFALDRSILWSTDAKLIGKKFPLNKDLEAAFGGRHQISMGVVGRFEKEEHVFFTEIGMKFVETYLPVSSVSEGKENIIAVVEIYRSPAHLFAAIEEGSRLMWLSAGLGGIFLFAVLFWVVRRADRIMRRQEAELVDSEKLGVTVEMASAVAHSLRNPLASIRSSAELALGGSPGADIREQLEDITAQTDRLAQWVSQYLVDVSPETLAEGSADLKQALAASIDHNRAQMERRGIRPVVNAPAVLPRARASGPIITQVLNSLIANALEAMPDGGGLTIGIESVADGSALEVTVHNTGKAMTASEIDGAFEPFATSKSGGLGLGLPVARRILTRLGGELTISSDHDDGVTARLSVPVAR